MGAPSRKVGEERAVSRKKVVVKVVGRRRRSIPEIFPPRKACPGGRRFGWCNSSVRGARQGDSGFRRYRGAGRSRGQRVEERGEVMVLICSSAEFRQHVGAVVPSGVEGFVGAMGLDLAEEEEVAQLTSCAKTFEAPVDEGFVRGRRERRVREVNGIKGISAV